MERFGLRSSRIITPEGECSGTVVVGEGLVEAVHTGSCEGLFVRDLGDAVLAPGLVDAHVHLNEPGRTEWEGFETATRAAAAGGVTTVVDMPLNCLPVTTSAAALRAKLDACAGKCFVDVGFWGGVVPGNGEELAGLAEGGVLGCKAFLVHSGIDEFPNSTESDLRSAMPILKDLGLPLLAHAELELAAPPPGDPRAYATYLASRPPEWEDAAIRLLVQLCRETRCPVHVVHLSAASSLETLRRAKEEGLPISVETCPHYLCFEAEAIADGATEFKCAPPIREHENRERLWQGLLDGVIDFVISDHSPCLPSLKQRERGDFSAAWGGIASLQLGLAAVWTEARRRGASLSRISQWMSTAPAAFAGLGGQKGRIARGAAADFAVWQPEESFAVRAEQLFFRHPLSPYVGRDLFGVIRETWLGGRRVFDGERHVGAAMGAALLGRRAA